MKQQLSAPNRWFGHHVGAAGAADRLVTQPDELLVLKIQRMHEAENVQNAKSNLPPTVGTLVVSGICFVTGQLFNRIIHSRHCSDEFEIVNRTRLRIDDLCQQTTRSKTTQQ